MKLQLALTIVMSAAESLLYNGCVFGWASIQPVLVQEGYFSDACQANETTSGACLSQAEQLNLVFTVIASIPTWFLVPLGFVLERYGTWAVRTVIISLYALGLTLTASSTPANSWMLFVSFSLCSFSGFGLLVVDIANGNLVPKYRASVGTLMCGAFDSATLVYLVFHELYKGGVSFESMFYGYAGLCAIFLAQTFFLTPKHTAPYTLPPGYVYGYKELPCFKSDSVNETEKEGDHASESDLSYDSFEGDGGCVGKDTMTLRECFKLVYTYTNLLHHCVIHFASTFFIGTFNIWIVTKVDAADVDFYTTAFGATQGLGIVFSPFSGLLIDYCRRKFTGAIGAELAAFKAVTLLLYVTDSIVILMLICSLIPSAELQIVTMALQVLARAFIYSTAAAFLTEVYPSKYFGVLYGLEQAVGGIVVLVQYPITLLVTRVLDDNFSIVHGILLGMTCLILAHPTYMLRLIKAKAAKRAEVLEKTAATGKLSSSSAQTRL